MNLKYFGVSTVARLECHSLARLNLSTIPRPGEVNLLFIPCATMKIGNVKPSALSFCNLDFWDCKNLTLSEVKLSDLQDSGNWDD